LNFIGYALNNQDASHRFVASSLTIQGFANGAPLEGQGMILARSSVLGDVDVDYHPPLFLTVRSLSETHRY